MGVNFQRKRLFLQLNKRFRSSRDSSPREYYKLYWGGEILVSGFLESLAETVHLIHGVLFDLGVPNKIIDLGGYKYKSYDAITDPIRPARRR